MKTNEDGKRIRKGKILVKITVHGFKKTQTCKQEYASAGKVLLNKHILNIFESCVETDRPTYLSLDASLPKHNN